MRRRLEDFELTKISAVDRPAQQGAVVTILKRAPSTALTFNEALRKVKRRSKSSNDPDAIDGEIDDWSDKGSKRRKKQKAPKAWSHEDISAVNDMEKARKTKHPFEVLTDNLARGHNIPRYMAQSLARHQAPASFRHYQQQGRQRPPPATAKAAPDDAVVAWDQAIATYVDAGMSRVEAMSRIRKQAPQLMWRRFRR